MYFCCISELKVKFNQNTHLILIYMYLIFALVLKPSLFLSLLYHFLANLIKSPILLTSSLSEINELLCRFQFRAVNSSHLRWISCYLIMMCECFHSVPLNLKVPKKENTHILSLSKKLTSVVYSIEKYCF